MALEFGAPWSRSLKVASSLAVVILAGTAAAAPLVIPARMPLAHAMMIGLPLGIVLSAFLTSVSGYTLSATALAVRRPFWNTAFDLAQLVSVAGDADALTGALRLFGNGGLFSFSGFFWNRRLGRFRAFATDPARAVVMKFRARTIVITPDDPQRFIIRVRAHLATTERA